MQSPIEAGRRVEQSQLTPKERAQQRMREYVGIDKTSPQFVAFYSYTGREAANATLQSERAKNPDEINNGVVSEAMSSLRFYEGQIEAFSRHKAFREKLEQIEKLGAQLKHATETERQQGKEAPDFTAFLEDLRDKVIAEGKW